MVKIEWIITDSIKDVKLKEFDTEWDGIFGYFQICINNHVLGFCPDRELLAGEEGNEDILYWLTKLSDGIIQLNTGQEYEINAYYDAVTGYRINTEVETIYMDDQDNRWYFPYDNSKFHYHEEE